MDKKVMAERQPTAQLIFPNRENVTTGQITNVLSVCQTAMAGLIHPWFSKDDDDEKPQTSEARIALENTLVRACARLDSILDDNRRWNIEYQMALEEEFKKSHAANLSFLKAQQQAAEEIITPHFQWKPTLVRTEDGLWIAILGDPDKASEGVYGLGRTPEEALDTFDKQFHGEKSPAVIKFLQEREAMAAQNQTHYAQNTMDTDGRGQVKSGSRTGEQLPVDSERDGEVSARDTEQGSVSGSFDSGGKIPNDTGFVDTGSGEKPTPSRIRKITAFLRRLFRLDTDRSGR